MVNNLEEQIKKGKGLIDKLRTTGRDTKALEERVKALEAQFKERLIEKPDNTPAWYTEEDCKAKVVLEGICKECAHLLIVKGSSAKDEFKGVWCAVLKAKLEARVESCPKFYAVGDEIDRLTKQMGIK